LPFFLACLASKTGQQDHAVASGNKKVHGSSKELCLLAKKKLQRTMHRIFNRKTEIGS
jgi:hypothetical protein